MSEVRFVLERSEHAGRQVIPVVDGHSLIDVARAYEADHGFDVTGGYDGLSIDHFGFGDLDVYLTGSSGVWPGDGRVALLGCDCGEPGCWPLFAHLGVTAGTVVWGNFENPRRPERDYSGFGPFTFDSDAYTAALRALAAELAA